MTSPVSVETIGIARISSDRLRAALRVLAQEISDLLFNRRGRQSELPFFLGREFADLRGQRWRDHFAGGSRKR